MDRLSEQKDLAMEKLRGQMEQLQQHMKDLEERNREMIEKLLQRSEAKKSTSAEAQTPAPSDTKQKPAI
jgi:hypothetical protein